MADSPENTTTSVSSTSPDIRVLLLDDEPANLHLRTAILRQHGAGGLEGYQSSSEQPLGHAQSPSALDDAGTREGQPKTGGFYK